MTSKKKGQTAKPTQGKKASVVSEGKKSMYSPAAIREFVMEVKAEFKKVVWPDKKVTVGLTGFVVILVVVISLYLGSVDLLLGKLVSLVLR